MSWKTTVALAVLVLGLGTFYYVWEVRLGPEREKAAGQKDRLFTVGPGDVAEAVLRRGDETLRLKREGDGWQVLEPVKARGDRGAIEDTLTSVATAKMDREIASAPASLGEFGLDRPAADLTLTLKDGKRLGLALGARTPTGVWVYARVHDRPAVVVVPEGVLRDATRPLADFRDKTVLAFGRSAVTGFEVVTDHETLAVERAEGKWKLIRPVALGADTDTVTEFLQKLESARVKAFAADAPRSLEPFGLERPLRVTIHTGADKDRASKTLLLGRVDGEKKGVYAMRPGESAVLLLPEEVWTGLPRNVAVLRDKVVVAFDRDKLTRLDIESPRGAVTLVHQSDRWRITAPEGLPADQSEVGGVLFRLADLRALAFLSDDASGIPRYLAKPEARVSLTQRDAPAPITLLLAPSPERRGGKPTAYAAVAGRGPVVLVDAKALGEIGRSANDLRDHALVFGLEPRDVKRVTATVGGQRLVLERAGEADWKVVEGGKGPAKSSKVEDLLYALRGLRWKEIADPGGREGAAYGLDRPTLELTLSRSDGTEIVTLLVGRREADRAWVRTKAVSTIYAVDAKALGDLPKTVDDFKG